MMRRVLSLPSVVTEYSVGSAVIMAQVLAYAVKVRQGPLLAGGGPRPEAHGDDRFDPDGKE